MRESDRSVVFRRFGSWGPMGGWPGVHPFPRHASVRLPPNMDLHGCPMGSSPSRRRFKSSTGSWEGHSWDVDEEPEGVGQEKEWNFQGLTSQERYLFLFSDLILIAKEKGLNSYKLKHKVRLSELWLSSRAPEGLVELSPSPATTLVIGWPTANYLAQFQYPEERDSWYRLLEENVEAERDRDLIKVVAVPVHYKVHKQPDEVRLIPVNNWQTAEDLLRLALSEFDLGDQPGAYQLWLRSPGEAAPYPLLGLESPFAILLHHLKAALPDGGSEAELAALASAPAPLNPRDLGVKAHFVLRPKSAHAPVLAALASTRPSTKSRRKSSGFVDKLRLVRQRLTRTDSGDHNRSLGLQAAALDVADGGGSATGPPGALFARPLCEICSNDRPVPAPILAMMQSIFNEGRQCEDIFRKPPKARTVKEIRELLDAGETVDFSKYYPTVVASVLKEFLRSIPGKLLLGSTYFEWVALSDPAPHSMKMAKAGKLVGGLPRENRELLRHLLCLLHAVAAESPVNHMDAGCLAVCIGPCLIDRPPLAHTQHSFKQLPLIARLLIDNTVPLFGPETLLLLGPLPPASPSPPPSTLRKHLQSHTSRDSGLSEDAPPMEDKPRLPRSFSESGHFHQIPVDEDEEAAEVAEKSQLRSTADSQSLSHLLCLEPNEVSDPETSVSETSPSQSPSPPAEQTSFRQQRTRKSSDTRNPRLRNLKKGPTTEVRGGATLERSASGEHLVLREHSEANAEPKLHRELTVAVSGGSPDSAASRHSRQSEREQPSSSGISSSSHDSLASNDFESAPNSLLPSGRSRAVSSLSSSSGFVEPSKPQLLSAPSSRKYSSSSSSAGGSDGGLIPADSSTVTETSEDEDEDDPTPVVSRESSKAKEYEAKVRQMFTPGPASSRLIRSPASQPRAESERRPGKAILKRRSLPSYEEAVARSRKSEEETAFNPRPCSRAEAGTVRDRIRRYDRENLRRKTLGADADSEAIRREAVARFREGRLGSAGVCAAIRKEQGASPAPFRPIVRARSVGRSSLPPETRPVSTPAATPTATPTTTKLPPSTALPSDKDKPTEISWSVRSLKAQFAADRDRPSIVPSSSEIPYQEPRSYRAVAAVVRRVGSAKAPPSTVSSNYAVLRPPPLEHTARPARLAPSALSAPVGGVRETPVARTPGKVRALASSFEAGRPPNTADAPAAEESYV